MNAVVCTVPDMPPSRVRACLAGLPPPGDYAVEVVPLAYEERPHLSGWTHFDDRRITIEVPHPFIPFGEVIPYAAKRRPVDDEMRFTWLTEGVTFRTAREVVRFVYLHEWMHWYLAERLARKSRAETTCDRFALWNYRRKVVTEDDARMALRRGAGNARTDRARSRPPEPAQLSLGFATSA